MEMVVMCLLNVLSHECISRALSAGLESSSSLMAADGHASGGTWKLSEVQPVPPSIVRGWSLAEQLLVLSCLGILSFPISCNVQPLPSHSLFVIQWRVFSDAARGAGGRRSFACAGTAGESSKARLWEAAGVWEIMFGGFSISAVLSA